MPGLRFGKYIWVRTVSSGILENIPTPLIYAGQLPSYIHNMQTFKRINGKSNSMA